MTQRTITRHPRPAERVKVPEKAFPVTFFALAFGLAAGVAFAGVVVPATAHAVLAVVLRIVAGA